MYIKTLILSVKIKGIKQLGKGVLSPDIVRKCLARRKEIFIVMTTGSSFIDTYSKDFYRMKLQTAHLFI